MKSMSDVPARAFWQETSYKNFTLAICADITIIIQLLVRDTCI